MSERPITPVIERAEQLEREGNVAVANGLLLKARRLFRQADALKVCGVQGGDVVYLTQLYWPSVHPALQEPRPNA